MSEKRLKAAAGTVRCAQCHVAQAAALYDLRPNGIPYKCGPACRAKNRARWHGTHRDPPYLWRDAWDALRLPLPRRRNGKRQQA